MFLSNEHCHGTWNCYKLLLIENTDLWLCPTTFFVLFCRGYFRQSCFEENFDIFLPLCLVNMSLMIFSAAILQAGAVKTTVIIWFCFFQHMLCVGMKGGIYCFRRATFGISTRENRSKWQFLYTVNLTQTSTWNWSYICKTTGCSNLQIKQQYYLKGLRMNGMAGGRDCTQSQHEFQIKFIPTANPIWVQRSHYIFSMKYSFLNVFHHGNKNCRIEKKTGVSTKYILVLH